MDPLEPELADAIARAGRVIGVADVLVVAAGAGMSAESGLPVYRGVNGLRSVARGAGYRPLDATVPARFATHPREAWAAVLPIYDAFRQARPHRGHEVLERWASARDSWVVTSNVDSLFQRSGFASDRIVELHGSLAVFQPAQPTDYLVDELWPAPELNCSLTDDKQSVVGELPTCPDGTGRLARPNALFFGDWWWLPGRTAAQETRFGAWLADIGSSATVILEIGCGTGLPTLRAMAETWAVRLPNATHIRIDPDPRSATRDVLEIPCRASTALQALDRWVQIR